MERVNQIIIIGPGNSGKTSLMSVLRVAAERELSDSSGLEIRAISQETRTLFGTAQRTVIESRLPIATTKRMTQYRFEMSFPSNSKWFRNRKTVEIRAMDGPGKVFFREEGGELYDYDELRKSRKTLIEGIRNAAGMILCLDATDEAATSAIINNLSQLIRAIGQPVLPVRRLVVCMTKVDKLFKDERRDAHEALRRTDPMDWADKLLTIPGRQLLRTSCANADIAFGWASVYGFLESGEPNYDGVKQCLRYRHADQQGMVNVSKCWRPFRVLDPFRYLVTGEPGDLSFV